MSLKARRAHLDPSEDNLFDWGSEMLLHRTHELAIVIFQQAISGIRILLALYRSGWRYCVQYDDVCSGSTIEGCRSESRRSALFKVYFSKVDDNARQASDVIGVR